MAVRKKQATKAKTAGAGRLDGLSFTAALTRSTNRAAAPAALTGRVVQNAY